MIVKSTNNLRNLKYRVTVALSGVFVLLAISCSKNNDNAGPKIDIYTVGLEANKSVVRKNGEVLSTLNEGLAFTSISVSNNDVYLAGHKIENGKLWAIMSKNGVVTNLSDGTNHATASGILLVGSNVYVIGYIRNSSDNEVATLWKNGNPIALASGENSSYATKIYSMGNDLYIAGREKNAAGNAIAKLWKNTTATNLTNGSENASAVSVYVSGNDVYATGYESNGTKDVAKIWKNGAATSLSDGSNRATAQSVYVSGNDVYAAGYEYNGISNRAILWKNGVEVNLSNAGDMAGTSVYVSGNDVYAAGGDYNLTKGGMVWKNGEVLYNLPGIAYSMFVVEK